MSLVGPRQLCLHLFCPDNSRNTSRGREEGTFPTRAIRLTLLEKQGLLENNVSYVIKKNEGGPSLSGR